MQLDKSRASALVLANRIQMCASGKFSFRFSRFSFHCRSEESSSPFLSSHKIACFCNVFFFYSHFSHIEFDSIFPSRALLLAVRALVLEPFSINTLTTFSFIWPERFFFPFSRPRLIHVLLKLHLPIYIACGVWLILPEPLWLGTEKSYWKFSIGWRLFFFPPLRLFHNTLSRNRFSFVRLLDQSFRFDFYRFSFFDSAAAIKRERSVAYVLVESTIMCSWSVLYDHARSTRFVIEGERSYAIIIIVQMQKIAEIEATTNSNSLSWKSIFFLQLFILLRLHSTRL